MKRKLPIFLLAFAISICVIAEMPLAACAVQVKSDDGQAMVSSEEEDTDAAPVYADQLAQGDYEISVESSSPMFRITKCVLHVADGKMTADMTLGGTGYSKLYMGTDKEAAKAADSDCIAYTEGEDGAYTYTVPVEALNKDTDCAAFSIRKQKWYPRTLVFKSGNIPQSAVIAATSSIGDNTPDSTASKSSDENTSSKGKDAYKKASSTAASKIKYDIISLPDGDYKIPVKMTGGSGRASISSPADMTVKNGKATAKIKWSSPNYDYMVINGLLYEPVNKSGNSEFEIPVTKFDGNMKVIADTTAMSQPYEVEYTLDFISDKAARQGVSTKTKGIILIVIIVAVAAAGYTRGRMRRGKREYDEMTAAEEEAIDQQKSGRKQ